MPIPININKLLDGTTVESFRIEFKEGWNPEAILHSICAFANDIDNSGGGYIVVGAAEEDGMIKRPIPGLNPNILDGIQKELLNICSKIQPKYMPICEPKEYEGVCLMVIWVPGGYDRPYNVPKSLNKGKSQRLKYVRRFSNTVQSNQADEREFMELAARVPYDDRINHNANVDDLDRALMENYLYSVNSSLDDIGNRNVVELAQLLRVVGGSSEYIKPLNIGLLMFSSDPEKYIPYSRIEVVDIPDPTGEGMEERTFRGPINRQLSDALAFIKNYVIAERVFKIDGQAESVRIFNYPYEAIEEALSNAVLHRGYNDREPITVRIEPGQLSILSTPGPDLSIRDEDIQRNKLVSKRYRNRRIGEFLKELHLIEGRNTGVPTMLKVLAANGSEPPVFNTDQDRTYFEVVFKEHKLFHKHVEKKEKSVRKKKRRRSREEIRNDSLKLLTNKDLSTNELAAELGYNGISSTLSEVIKELIEQGEISYSGSDSVRSPNLKLHKN
ncbi:RNA-binding domain-containing protein [Adlercreutzia sp. ZJ154]|uniref:RNA-binding domain-containing protein n=1 Tax=Adlercreutzia sp. ZJ154 TaxID=2709790 RepID=UPI0013EC45BE|nr:RNA-binding domain-containing protein [Adlercreutzia sp. ZJ154]